ncbi:MAG: hypothetical protein JOZ22_19345, partial [Acidobacteriia bacterium]|nr:hypothetical protein [Terriglobia bacterium]
MRAEKAPFAYLLLATTLCTVSLAQQPGQPVAGYKLLNTISIPGGLTGFDISWVDASSARYYLADRGNANATPPVSPRIDVIDTLNNQFLTSINLTAGANGVVAIPRAHELWVGLSDSTVVVINTDNDTTAHVISTGGSMRADELAWDPVDRIILIANDRDSPPFVTFISEQNYTVLGTLKYDGASAPKSTGGIEQSVWNATTLKFYIAIPATSTNPNGEIDEIDPHSMSVTRVFPTTCMGPSGLALIPNQRLITACGDILDIATGKVLSTVKGASGDEIWYNSGDQRVYFGSTANVIVVDATTNATAPLTTLVVGQVVPAPGVSNTTHSVAADANNNLVLVPVTGM